LKRNIINTSIHLNQADKKLLFICSYFYFNKYNNTLIHKNLYAGGTLFGFEIKPIITQIWNWLNTPWLKEPLYPLFFF